MDFIQLSSEENMTWSKGESVTDVASHRTILRNRVSIRPRTGEVEFPFIQEQKNLALDQRDQRDQEADFPNH